MRQKGRGLLVYFVYGLFEVPRHKYPIGSTPVFFNEIRIRNLDGRKNIK